MGYCKADDTQVTTSGITSASATVMPTLFGSFRCPRGSEPSITPGGRLRSPHSRSGLRWAARPVPPFPAPQGVRMTRQSPIVEFIAARLDDDEKTAQGCLEEVGGALKGDPWPDSDGTVGYDDYPSYPWGSGEVELAYMARTRPALMLRDIESKRRILDEYEDTVRWYDQHKTAPAGEVHGLWKAVRLLAEPYSDHQDFDPAWSTD